MAPTAGNSRKNVGLSTKTQRNGARSMNSTAMEDIDSVGLSQSSSDDGIMATIAQQMQATMEKKKKEKETKFLHAAQSELSKLLSEKASSFSNNVNEINKIFSEFQDAYARNEDQIRKLLDAILKEQLNLQIIFDEKNKNSIDMEKRREKEHIQALTRGRKACEEFDRLVGSLEPN
ncbi:hypothetical protein PNOK_0843700 [Pyrrhoderma noxium]|uniref:Uncharacterized protein n=1 Tax=Pyrrhoderma noxium TaxID=2282107 RepID=A0A286U7T7_9AGAM|nr:hypothetical protein PNOK_0843700 [Pyrrhoderma noxium]